MPKRDKQDKFVQRSLSQQAWIQFRNNRLAICGLVVIALLILVSITTILIWQMAESCIRFWLPRTIFP